MGKHTTAGDIATEIRKRIQEHTAYLPDRKLHALLYLAQGAWLVVDDEPLFDEQITATEAGVHVAGITDTSGTSLGDPYFGHVGVIVARYGGLSALDLESLIRGQGPWAAATTGRAIDVNSIRKTFRDQAETPEGTLSGFPRSERLQWHPPHDPDRPRPSRPDSREDIEAFIAETKARM